MLQHKVPLCCTRGDKVVYGFNVKANSSHLANSEQDESNWRLNPTADGAPVLLVNSCVPLVRLYF